MKKLAIGIGLAVGLLGACKGKDVTKEMEALADRSCECKEVECARKVVADLLTLVGDTKNPSGDEDKVSAAAQRIGECSVEAGMPLEEVIELGEKLEKM